MAATNIQTFAGQVEVTSNLTVDTNTLHVDSVAGRVGIGKTDPAFAMDVDGTVNATALYVGGSELPGSPWTETASSNIYYASNVAIGTNTDPTKTLEVAGPMRITDGLSNVCDLSVVGSTGAWIHQAEITAPDAASGDRFGFSVSISGDGSYAIAGAYMDDRPGQPSVEQSGSAQIYVRDGSTWTHQAQITHPSVASGDSFGYSVAISDDGSYAIAGAIGDNSPYKGSAQIYVRDGSTWSHQAQITHPSPAAQDYFGFSVSISGDGSYALVGAQYDGAGIGSAHIFVRDGSTWSNQAALANPSPAPDDRLGISVSISSDGSYALVGAAGDNSPYTGSAQIYVRDGSTWSHQAEITAPDAASGDYFGFSVSISGDGSYAIAGAYLDDRPGQPTNEQSGSAHIFVRDGSTWSHQAQITHPSAGPLDYFGRSVSISSDGSCALVGAHFDNSSAGSAHIYVRSGSTWSNGTEITHPEPGSYTHFGRSVSISGDGAYALVGAYLDSANGTNSGTAQIYTVDPGSLIVNRSIVANGTLLSFTGQHICFPEGPMGQGLVVSANKNKYVSLNGSLTTGNRAIKSSEALPVVSLSNVVNDRSVFGVVDHFEQSGTTRSQTSGATVIRQDKEVGDDRVVVNSLGEGALWVANTNGNLVSGDYVTTSNLPGYAQRQDDDILRSCTVAKSTMDCDFEPEDLPVQVILKDDDGNNVLDSYGRLQWVDSDRTEPAYRIRYLDVSGTPTDEANAVHKAAYVGCTYHCG